MAVIYYVEHGDTPYDVRGCAQGLIDVGLTERGKSQAESAARTIRGKGIDCIYCSPLKRARQTADIICEVLGGKVIERPNLTPLDIGQLAGKKESQVAGYLEFFSSRPTLKFPDGESFGEFYKRAQKEWAHQFADDDPVIAVVAHSRDWQLLNHWAKHGMDADAKGIEFTEPKSAQVARLQKSGNSIRLQKVS